MTALAAAPSIALRPVPWKRLAWVTWRRYRFTLISVLGILAVLTVSLFIAGQHARTAYEALQTCHPKSAANCRYLDETFHNTYGSIGFLGTFLMLLPGILGAFAGGPLLARELETGTFRYAWTQGVGRMRWAAALVVPGAVGIAMIMVSFGAVITWREQPLIEYGATTRLDVAIFPVSGLAVAGWAMAGFALGVLAGLLWRRVLPAVATAFGVWFGLAYLAAKDLRPHYLAPLQTTSLNLSSHNFFVSQWWTKAGVRVSDSEINRILQALGADVSGNQVKVHVSSGGAPDPIRTLIQQGYTQVTSYQPVSRYWTMQWIEFGWLAAFSLVLLGATFWLLHRRTG